MDAARTISALRRVDEQHLRESAMTALHPAAHLAAALAFIMAVLSHGAYGLSGLVPFILYPAAVMLFGGIPFGLVASRAAPALPFVALVGASGLLFAADKSAALAAFFVLCVKCVLCVSAALLLVCVCGIGGITLALDFFRVPKILAAQLSFTYRYLHVLAAEIAGVLRAYSLRSSGRGVSVRRFGPICGGLFLRSMKHADAIYAAMLCRGFNGAPPASLSRPLSCADVVWTLCWLVFFIICSLFDLPTLLGNLILGMI